MGRMQTFLAIWLAFSGGAAAQSLWIEIDLSDQRMQVRSGEALLGDWRVSTAREGKCTPTGIFTPYLLKREHYSTLYDGAPMPWSIFFSGNYAIHGTTQVDRLGSPASAGCVRLDPVDAETLFGLVQEAGKDETRVVIRE